MANSSDSSLSSISSASSSSSGNFSSSVLVRVTSDEFALIAYRGRKTSYRLTLLDRKGEQLPIQSSNLVRIKVGRDNDVTVLDVRSDAATANGSTVTATNPMDLVLHQDDTLIAATIYDIEIAIEDADELRIHLAHGSLAMIDTQLGKRSTT
jgi:hypothetical protein